MFTYTVSVTVIFSNIFKLFIDTSVNIAIAGVVSPIGVAFIVVSNNPPPPPDEPCIPCIDKLPLSLISPYILNPSVVGKYNLFCKLISLTVNELLIIELEN